MTTTEQHAADYVLARFFAAESVIERESLYQAYLLLTDRNLRHAVVPVTNTTDDYKRAPRGRHCGRWTMEGHAVDGSHVRYQRLDCKCWDCLRCAKKKAARYRRTIAQAAEANGLTRFLTLTLDPKQTPEKGAVQYIKACWARLRANVAKTYGKGMKYICVMEFQHATKMPHLHIVLDRYIPQAWLKNAWMVAGGGEHVDIRAVDLHRVSHYLAKYLTKELLCSAPKRSRRVTVSHGITLNPKPAGTKTHVWDVLRENIFVMLYRLRAGVQNIAHDADQVLQSFVVPTPKLAV